jgi:hemimethylated DNA binding protein
VIISSNSYEPVTNLGLFSIVVKHKVEDWRGVVVGWERSDNESDYGEEQPTSLTQKNYPLDPDDNVKYMIVLDGNDAHLHYSKRRESHNLSMAEFFQSDLETVKDESLRRIRSSHISEFFKRFDSQTKSFVPNEILAYEFPADMDDYPQFQLSQKSEAASQDVISGAQEAANHLRSIILGYTSAPESRNMKLLSYFLVKLTALSEGDVVPVQDKLSDEHIPANKLASMHLKQLLNLTVYVGELLWQRRRTLENQKEIKFGLGDVVSHKVYGFRGVVVAWDPEPSFDVSRWDGLTHIKNPHEYPFYHIIPDQDDCIKAFGGERSSRYVCEENLEICPVEQRRIDVDLEPEWEFNHADRVYIPPDDLKVRRAVYIPELCLLYISHFLQFKYGEDLDDDGMTERCLKEIRDALSHIFVSGRDGISSSNPDIDSISKQMALNNLLELLKSAQDMEVASIVSESLKEIWKAHLNDQLRWKLDTAVAHLLAGKVSQALEDFSEVVDDDPSYAEAWNKASTCEFMMGNMDASLAAAHKTIECLPTHFQALNGLGLVYYEKKDLSSAIDCFRKSMDLDPWSPVSARLSVCLETVKSEV